MIFLFKLVYFIQFYNNEYEFFKYHLNMLQVIYFSSLSMIVVYYIPNLVYYLQILYVVLFFFSNTYYVLLFNNLSI
jgi:hypothetical protein